MIQYGLFPGYLGARWVCGTANVWSTFSPADSSSGSWKKEVVPIPVSPSVPSGTDCLRATWEDGDKGDPVPGLVLNSLKVSEILLPMRETMADFFLIIDISIRQSSSHWKQSSQSHIAYSRPCINLGQFKPLVCRNNFLLILQHKLKIIFSPTHLKRYRSDFQNNHTS